MGFSEKKMFKKHERGFGTWKAVPLLGVVLEKKLKYWIEKKLTSGFFAYLR